jgi:hypothetical protein
VKPYTGPRKRVRGKIGATTVSFTLPKNCVQSGATFGIRIKTTTPRRRRRARARLTSVTFKLDAKTLKRDRRKPFSVTVKTTGLAAGSRHTVRAGVRARVARGKGKRPKTRRKTLKGSFRIC